MSRIFANFARFTAEQTFAHREPSIAEIDPDLAQEINASPPNSRFLQGEWRIGDTKIYSGINDGGDTHLLPLMDGEILEATVMGHFNIERELGSSIIRHFLTTDGEVLAGTDAYRLMPDDEIEALIDEFTPKDFV